VSREALVIYSIKNKNMFVNPTSVGISQRVVATLVACAVVLASIGYYTTAQAASLVDVSDTLSDSAPSVFSAHRVAFTVPAVSSLVATDSITITFPAAFTTVNNVATGDITVTVNGTPDAHTNFALAGNGVTFDGIVAASGDDIVVAIADGNITNPGTIGSQEITVTTEDGDSGKTRVAIVNTVLVSASVATTFTFTISGVATSTSINGETTTGSTSPTVINFGQLTAGSPEVLGQRLNVATNANDGFVVTVETDGDLESANGAVIDVFDDGVDQPNPSTTWNSPGNNVADQKTWGHWGLTTRDTNLNSLGGFYTNEFAVNEFISATTTPRAVFHHDGPSSLNINDVGSSTVAYKVEITALQEAADDYNTTLTYIATPTF
jgi:hypothetical protein